MKNYCITICDFNNMIKMQLNTDSCKKMDVIKLLHINGYVVVKRKDANHYIHTSEIGSDTSILNLWLTKI